MYRIEKDVYRTLGSYTQAYKRVPMHDGPPEKIFGGAFFPWLFYIQYNGIKTSDLDVKKYIVSCTGSHTMDVLLNGLSI